GAALRNGDGDRLTGHFNIERLLDELIALDIVPRHMVQNRAAVIRGMRLGMGRALTQQGAALEWNTSEIKNIKRLPGGELAVIVRHQTTVGYMLKMRWWLVRRSGSWQIYDLEDLDLGVRVSTAAAGVIQDGRNNMAQLARAGEHLRAAKVALVVRQDLDAAERELQA